MAYSVYSYPSAYPDTGMLTLYAGTSRENAEPVLSMIRQEIDALLKEGLHPGEFQQAVAQLRGGYTLGLESTSSRMSSIGRSLLLRGRVKTEDEVLSAIDAVTPEDVVRVAKASLDAQCSAALVGNDVEGISLAFL